MNDPTQKPVGANSGRHDLDAYHPRFGVLANADEIDLFDIWEATRRRKWLILIVMATIMTGAISYALVKPDIYRYNQVIEIGRHFVDGNVRAIQSPESVTAKLNENLISIVIRRWIAENPGSEWMPRLRAITPADADIVVVSSEASEDHGGTIKEVLRQTAELVREDHKTLFSSMQTELKRKVLKARNDIQFLEEEGQRVDDRVSRTYERERLLLAEIEQLEVALNEVRNQRRTIIDDDPSDIDPVRQIVLSSDARQIRTRLNELQRMVEIDLPEKRDELQRRRSEITRRVEEIQTNLDAAQGQLYGLTQTSVSEPQRSVEAIGANVVVIALLGLIAGVLLGGLAAFMAEFTSAATKRREVASTDA